MPRTAPRNGAPRWRARRQAVHRHLLAGGVVPGVNDFAHFQGGANASSVSVANNATPQGMYIHCNQVTWNPGGRSIFHPLERMNESPLN